MGIKPSFLDKPLVASLCGTFLKPEMQSVYRQVTGLRRHRTVVLTERHLHPDQFPFAPVIVMEKPPPAVRTKRRKQRQRGNFIRRFYYKHLLKTWPPPEKPRPPAPPPPPVYDDAYNLVDLLRQHRPRLAHVYYGHKAVKYLPMLRRWGGPLVVSFHGMDITGDAYRPGDPATLAEVFAHARLILGRSQSLLERLAELGCPPEKLRLNHTSIPLERLAPTIRAAPEDGRWILLQACRLIPKKGLFTTLAALREVARVQPHARLIVAGSGPLLEDLRAQAGELGLTDQVEFTGWCSQERLLRLYAQAHLFLHPSELTASGDQEGIPNALLEAMGSGLPAVATRHGGIPEAVTDGLDGLLVPEKSPQLLAAAILRLTGESDALSRMSQAAAANIARNFGADRQIQALEDCYEEACASAATTA
jgi:colanic acid/amylovoran biosynthesis glycosyltransferase